MPRQHDPLASPEPLIRRVYSYVAYRLGDGPDAEDVTSETFARALRYRDSYDAGAGTEQAWLLGIARRVVNEHLQQTARDSRGVDLALDPEADLAGDVIERLALREAMAGLSQEDRDLLGLRYGADLKVSDIASVMGVRTNAVEVALHRAVGRLRGRLGAQLSV